MPTIDNMTSLIPELSLCYAVLERAVLDASGNVTCGYRRDKQVRAQALQWILDGSTHAWGFVWICDHLDVCSKSARRNILKIITLGDAGKKTQLTSYGFNRRAFVDLPSVGDWNLYYIDSCDGLEQIDLYRKLIKSIT